MHPQRVIGRAAGGGALAVIFLACSSTPNVSESAGPQSTPSLDAGSSSSDALANDAATTDADAGSVDDDGGADSGADADDLGPPPPCATISVGTGELLPFSTAGDDRGLSVTPDGLSAAWITVTGSNVTVHYVDRADSSSAFGAERTKTGSFAAERVALTPDGLGLAVVNADRLGFSVLARASRSNSFGAPKLGPFANLNDQGVKTYKAAGLTYADPVFAHDGLYFLFSRVGGPSTEPTVLLGSRFSASDPLSPGGSFLESVLLPDGSNRKVVTALSVDERTVFVWDEAVQKTRVVTRSADLEVVTGSSDFGAMKDVQVTADCKAVYYVQSGDIYRSAVP